MNDIALLALTELRRRKDHFEAHFVAQVGEQPALELRLTLTPGDNTLTMSPEGLLEEGFELLHRYASPSELEPPQRDTWLIASMVDEFIQSLAGTKLLHWQATSALLLA